MEIFKYFAALFQTLAMPLRKLLHDYLGISFNYILIINLCTNLNFTNIYLAYHKIMVYSIDFVRF